MSMVALNTRHVELVVKEDLEGENALSWMMWSNSKVVDGYMSF